jgi:hypothetical protein
MGKKCVQMITWGRKARSRSFQPGGADALDDPAQVIGKLGQIGVNVALGVKIAPDEGRAVGQFQIRAGIGDTKESWGVVEHVFHPHLTGLATGKSGGQRLGGPLVPGADRGVKQ